MKILKLSAILLTCCLLNVLVLSNSHKSRAKQLFPSVRPTVGDLKSAMKQVIQPFYAGPYYPQEVEKLEAPLKPTIQQRLMTAELVGKPQGVKGMDNPTIYSTVVERHPTSIVHPHLKPIVVQSKSRPEMDFSSEPMEKPSPNSMEIVTNRIGSYKIPVNFQGAGYAQGLPNVDMNKFEVPSFIHKSEKKQAPPNYSNPYFLNSALKQESAVFENQFRSMSGYGAIKTLFETHMKLNAQSQELANEITQSLNMLIMAKENTIKLSNLLSKYEASMQTYHAKELRLADLIEVKKQLTDKLLKEIEGVRTANSAYPALQNINPIDVQRIIVQIKQKLGIF